MQYKHKYEIDSFYPLPDADYQSFSAEVKTILSRSATRKPRVRVTRDQKTGDVLAKLVKARISDIHVYNPEYRFDYRISINLEADWPGDVEELTAASASATTSMPDRFKDRMSYSHSYCQMDLTQVKSHAQARTETAVHELEVSQNLS